MRSPWLQRAIASIALLGVAAHAEAQQSLHDFIDPLKQASCPEGAGRREPEAIDLKAARVPLQGVNPSRKTIGALTFVDGFHLTSADKRFGGVSGIDILDDGELLAVTDAGDFVWLDLADDTVTPVAARIAAMRGADGKSLGGKAHADAEGLSLLNGLALVSFEGDHRVLAFDLAGCGAAARGAPVAGARGEFGAAFRRQELKVGGNEGAEALATTQDGVLFVGLETKVGSASAVSARAIETPMEFDVRIGAGAPGLVGLDILPSESGVTAYSLHRSTNAMASSVIVLMETQFERYRDPAGRQGKSESDERSGERFRPVASRTLASMNLFVTIDNFEGVAARKMPDGRVRLYVVADDNFSASQRTLLMVYDIAERD